MALQAGATPSDEQERIDNDQDHGALWDSSTPAPGEHVSQFERDAEPGVKCNPEDEAWAAQRGSGVVKDDDQQPKNLQEYRARIERLLSQQPNEAFINDKMVCLLAGAMVRVIGRYIA